MKKFLLFTVVLCAYIIPSSLYSQLPDLGTTSGFAFFTAAGAFTVTGASVVTGDVGTHAGAYAAFPPGVLIGNPHVANTLTALAATDVLVAYQYLDGLICNNVVGVTFGNGQILTPGVHCVGAASTIEGNLTLNGLNDPNSIFIIQIDGALASATNSTVTLINGASICNIFWQINGAVELGVNSFFRGNILAAGAISLYSGSSIEGRALTTAGAISLSDNVASICALDFGISCPATITVSCSSAVPVPNLAAITIIGNCATLTVDADVIQNYTCENNYAISRVYRATNDCGTISTCEQIITVLDAIAPVLTCIPDVTVSCESDVPAANPGGIGATDNCGATVTVTVLPDAISNVLCDNQYTITRVYTATDECGNAGTCAQIITVNNAASPTITCPADLSFTCTTEVPASDISQITGADGCGDAVTISVGADVVSNFICANNYTISRTYTATDDCGNTATCVQTITIADSGAPTITCPADLTLTCVADAPAPDTNISLIADNCGGILNVTVAPDVLTGTSCATGFSLLRVYTVTDLCGNTGTCAQSMTIQDDIAPTIICPPTASVTCGLDFPVPGVGVVTNDNCVGLIDLTFEQVASNGVECEVMRTYTATDICGNTATCEQIISVIDNVAPVITCAATLTVGCAGDAPAASVSAAIVTDACDPAVIVTLAPDVISNLTCENGFTITRLFTATDACGNVATCLQTIIVNDEEVPVISFCPPAITIACGADLPASDIGLLVASDNCTAAGDLNMFSTDVFNGGNGCGSSPAITSRIYTVQDACGNEATCVQTINMTDDESPVITSCPSEVNIACVADLVAGDVQLIVATDNCTITEDLAITFDDIDNGGSGCNADPLVIQRTYVVSDVCGNTASCAQILNIVDNEAPVIINCPAEVTINCIDDLDPGNTNLISVTDNCAFVADPVIDVLDISNNGSGCASDPLIINRTFTVSDACGNSSVCTQVITLIDNVAPVIQDCPADLQLTCIEDVPGAAELTASADCSDVVVSMAETNNGGTACLLDPLIISRTYTATDDCGNTSACTQLISIINESVPVIQNCPLSLQIVCLGDMPAVSIVTASSICSVATVAMLESNNGGSGCGSDPLIISRTYTATDACGNTSSCTQLITILNQSVPVIENCPSDLQFDCIADLPAAGSVTATGNCGDAVVTMQETNNGGSGCGNDPLIITRTYTATDACGNTSVCAQTITVVDEISPVIQNCPADVQYVCIEEVPSANTNQIITSDNCITGNVSFVESNNGGGGCGSDPLIITRIFTVSDACGNTASCDQIITIIDDEAPVITVQHPTLGILANGETISIQCESNTAGWNVEAFVEGMALVTDNCSQDAAVVFTANSNAGTDCENEGFLMQMTYQWTATDNCGNVSSFSVIIEVVDTIAPVLVGVPDDITVSCDAIPATASALPCGTIAQTWSDYIIVIDECECAEVTFEEIVIEGNCNTANVILRIWTGTDNCGNTVRDTQRVNVINNSGPDFLWNTDITGNIANGEILEVECFQGGLPAWVYDLDFRSMQAVDACQSNSDLRVSFNYEFMGFGDCITDGYVQAYEFVWTATSSCGVLGEFKFQIHLTDTTAPVIENWQELVCPGPFVEDKWVVAESCSGVAFDVSESNVASTCNPGQQDILRTLILTDGCNNTAEYQQLVASPEDGPVFEWKAESFNNALSGDTILLECGVMGANTISGISKHDLTASAGCSNILNVDFKEELMYEGDCFENEFLKTVKLTWTATDECLQTSVFELMVNLMDNTAPVIHSPNRITVMCGQEIPAPLVTDYCSEVSVRVEELSRTFTDCPDYMVIQRNIIAADECGNTHSMKQEVTMTSMGVDMFAGIDMVICITGTQIPALPDFTDPCTGDMLIPEVRLEAMHSDCGLPGTMRRMIKLTNNCGMVSEMEQTILMRTQLIPELVIVHPVLGMIKDKTELKLECGEQEINFNVRQARLVNSCPGDEIRFEINETFSTDCKADGFIKRMEYKWTANDVCGNQTIFSIFVNFNDTQSPVFTNIPVNQEITCGDLPEVDAPEISDLCSEVDITYAETRIEREGVVFVTRTWIAEDDCGNSSQVSQEITMRSNSELDCNMELMDSMICNGDNIRVSTDISGPYTYFWEVEGGACFIMGGQGTSMITINVGFSDVTVRLRVIDENGCPVECVQTFSCQSNQNFAGLKAGASNVQVTELFPNPAAHEVNVKYTAANASTGKIRVFDLMGRTRFTTSVEIQKGSHQLQIALDQLTSSGFYFIELESDNVVKTYRFIKN